VAAQAAEAAAPAAAPPAATLPQAQAAAPAGRPVSVLSAGAAPLESVLALPALAAGGRQRQQGPGQEAARARLARLLPRA
jgi:hypothetical protein